MRQICLASDKHVIGDCRVNCRQSENTMKFFKSVLFGPRLFFRKLLMKDVSQHLPLPSSDLAPDGIHPQRCQEKHLLLKRSKFIDNVPSIILIVKSTIVYPRRRTFNIRRLFFKHHQLAFYVLSYLYRLLYNYKIN